MYCFLWWCGHALKGYIRITATVGTAAYMAGSWLLVWSHRHDENWTSGYGKHPNKILDPQSDHNLRFYLQQTLMSAMGTLGGSNFIFPRLYRHMFVVAVDSFEDSTIIRIFTAIGDWHFAKGYPEKVALLARVCSISQPAHNRHVAETTTNTTETRTHSRGISCMVFLLVFFFLFWLDSRRWRI